MNYLFRIYHGKLQYICLVNIEYKDVRAYTYHIVKQLYAVNNSFIYDTGNLGSAMKEMFTDEYGLIKKLFTEVEK